jgi:hypothetical protein
VKIKEDHSGVCTLASTGDIGVALVTNFAPACIASCTFVARRVLASADLTGCVGGALPGARVFRSGSTPWPTTSQSSHTGTAKASGWGTGHHSSSSENRVCSNHPSWATYTRGAVPAQPPELHAVKKHTPLRNFSHSEHRSNKKL